MDQLPLKPFSLTSYRVSTITATGSIQSCVNLSTLFESIEIGISPYLKYVEYGASKTETNSKGESGRKPKRNTINKPAVRKRFDNQMTFVFHKGGVKYNVKLFKNGNVQMTGVKDVAAGSEIVDELIRVVKYLEHMGNRIAQNVDGINNSGLKICLMNCDFKVLFNINRNALHKVLLDAGYACTYEPCIYQGVKLSYFISDDSYSGKCNCALRCSGKGTKTHCKRITVAFFQSGAVTINGANNKKQLDMLYNFVERVIRENTEVVQQTYFKPRLKLHV